MAANVRDSEYRLYRKVAANRVKSRAGTVLNCKEYYLDNPDNRDLQQYLVANAVRVGQMPDNDRNDWEDQEVEHTDHDVG